jgi:hypothetical protein
MTDFRRNPKWSSPEDHVIARAQRDFDHLVGTAVDIEAGLAAILGGCPKAVSASAAAHSTTRPTPGPPPEDGEESLPEVARLLTLSAQLSSAKDLGVHHWSSSYGQIRMASRILRRVAQDIGSATIDRPSDAIRPLAEAKHHLSVALDCQTDDFDMVKTRAAALFTTFLVLISALSLAVSGFVTEVKADAIPLMGDVVIPFTRDVAIPLTGIAVASCITWVLGKSALAKSQAKQKRSLGLVLLESIRELSSIKNSIARLFESTDERTEHAV